MRLFVAAAVSFAFAVSAPPGAQTDFGGLQVQPGDLRCRGLPSPPLWHCSVAASITYGAIGALIDWLRVGRTSIYRGAATASGQSSRVEPPVVSAGEGSGWPSPPQSGVGF